jgi:chemotaxis protein CheX
MSLQDFILEAINQSTQQVFSTMMGSELERGEVLPPTYQEEDPPCEVVGLIGVAGSWAGTGNISCSADTACKVCAHMLMTEATAVNEDVLDAVAELTNMIIGNVKTELESQVGPLGLSIPTVVYGRNFHTKTAGTPGWIILRFRWGADAFTVKFCLTPQHRDTHSTPVSMLETASTTVLEPAGAH